MPRNKPLTANANADNANAIMEICRHRRDGSMRWIVARVGSSASHFPCEASCALREYSTRSSVMAASSCEVCRSANDRQ